jgi:hypothetical protein
LSGAKKRGAAALLLCVGRVDVTDAHELLMRYNLPVPFRLYLYACAATLLVTFLLFCWFMRASRAVLTDAVRARARRPWHHLPRWLTVAIRGAAVGCLLLTIIGGLIGTRDPDDNLNLTLFWDIFLLGCVYLTALFGNIYGFANPWQVLADLVAHRGDERVPARLAYPENLGYWPAVGFYVAVVWLELFTLPGPRALSVILIIYSAVTFAGMAIFGQREWIKHCEVFSVLLRLIGMMAPIEYRRSATGSVQMQFRWPLSGLLRERPESLGLVVFALFILAGTTYDGMHQTLIWKNVYWQHLLPDLRSIMVGKRFSDASVEYWYDIFQKAGLVFAPFLYLAIYLGILTLAKVLTRNVVGLRTLALALVLSILPIALVYNLSHYFTLILIRTPVLPYLLSDPFGYGWNPLHLPHLGDPPILNMAAVWHTEVALILIGHIVSVWLAHRVALQLFVRRRDAVVSQIPMLALMMAYTVLGLWVISLPFALLHK